jgi:ABC-type multidrug transport system fused ATPase/permease subunit
MVFEQGKIVEFDSPATLLANPTSKFTLLIEAARQAAARNHSRGEK